MTVTATATNKKPLMMGRAKSLLKWILWMFSEIHWGNLNAIHGIQVTNKWKLRQKEKKNQHIGGYLYQWMGIRCTWICAEKIFYGREEEEQKKCIFIHTKFRYYTTESSARIRMVDVTVCACEWYVCELATNYSFFFRLHTKDFASIDIAIVQLPISPHNKRTDTEYCAFCARQSIHHRNEPQPIVNPGSQSETFSHTHTHTDHSIYGMGLGCVSFYFNFFFFLVSLPSMVCCIRESATTSIEWIW